MRNNNGAVRAQQSKKQNKKSDRCTANLFLLVVGAIMTFSGMYIQIRYHMQGDYTDHALDFTRWALIHKWSALLFTVIVICHVLIHLKWYKSILEKRLFRRNRITLILTLFMFIVSVLGFVPWIISLFSAHSYLRHIFIEVHDKIALIFMVLMIGHIIKRGKWYTNMR